MIIDHKKVIDLIVSQLRDYATTSGKSSFVVGLNGDVGSALVALLCKKTNINLYCISADILVKDENRDALKKITSKNHLYLMEIDGLDQAYNDLQKEIDYRKQLNEYAEGRGQYFDIEKATENLKYGAALPVLSTIAAGFNGLIVGSRSKNDLLYRTYNKYGAGNADIFPLADLYKSEIIELFEYVATPMCYGATYILDKEKNKTFTDITDLEVEWADREDERTQVVTSDNSPDRHRDWQRFTLRQRQIIAKLNQLEKLSRHKVNSNLQFCKVRNIDSLTR